MKYLFLCLILVLGSSALLALPRIAYIGASAILPGSGELLLGYNNRGGTHLAVEVLSITGYILTGREMDLIEKNYQEYASAYAGVLASQSDNYYQDLQDYYSSAEFNQLLEMSARNYFLIVNYDPAGFEAYLQENLYTEEESWQWSSPETWQGYKDKRRKFQRSKINHNAVLGALVLNRVISVLDVSLLTRGGRRHRSTLSSIYVNPLPDSGLMLNYQLKF